MVRSSESGHGDPQALGRRRRRELRRWLWASVPLWSLGLLSSVPFAARARSTRRRRDRAVAAGYLAATAITLALSVAGGISTKPGAPPDGTGTLAGALFLTLMIAGALHTSIAFRHPKPARGPADPSNTAAVAAARATALRRVQARRIAETDPTLARDLGIGRPDVRRDYDDGGLVDVNRVPAEVLRRALDWTRDEAQAVVAARDEIGGFGSAAEITAYAAIDPARVDMVADLLLFRRGSWCAVVRHAASGG